MSTDLAVRNSDIERISALRLSISKIDTLEDANEASDQARAIQTYAKAKKSAELVNAAVELRMWTERRAGQLVLDSRQDYKSLAREHRVRPHEVNRWVMWALASEADLNNYLREEREANRELSLGRMRADILASSEKRVAPSIYRRLDGSYEVRWKKNGRPMRRSYPPRTKLESMQRHLADAKTSRNVTDLDRAATQVRLLLGNLEAQRTTAKTSVRELIGQAMSGLYTAEDSLAKACKESEL